MVQKDCLLANEEFFLLCTNYELISIKLNNKNMNVLTRKHTLFVTIQPQIYLLSIEYSIF